jgi:hypothetical protein
MGAMTRSNKRTFRASWRLRKKFGLEFLPPPGAQQNSDQAFDE